MEEQSDIRRTSPERGGKWGVSGGSECSLHLCITQHGVRFKQYPPESEQRFQTAKNNNNDPSKRRRVKDLKWRNEVLPDLFVAWRAMTIPQLDHQVCILPTTPFLLSFSSSIFSLHLFSFLLYFFPADMSSTWCTPCHVGRDMEANSVSSLS